MFTQEFNDRPYRQRSGLLNEIAVNAGTNGRKRHRPAAMFHCQFQGRFDKHCAISPVLLPSRLSNGVKDKLGVQRDGCYHLTLTAASWQLVANLLPFDGKPAFTGIWQYAWKIAWAAEKSVVILGDYCLLPNPTIFYTPSDYPSAVYRLHLFPFRCTILPNS